jgi:hypothetical protein
MRAVIALLCFIDLGCSSKTAAPPAPQEAEPDTQSLAKGNVSSVLSALSQSHSALSALFGPHQLNISVQSKLSKDKEITVNLQEEILLSVDASGTAHVQNNNNQNQGFDAYITKSSAALATRYGPLQLTTPEVVNQARDTALSALYANLEPLSPWLILVPGTQREIAGKKGLLFTLDKKEAAAPPINLAPEKAWRATIKPEIITGELVLDPQSGFLLFADLYLRYTAVRNQQEILFEINIKANLMAFGEATAAITMPEIEPLEPRLRVENDRLDIIGKAALQQQKENKKKTPKFVPKPVTQPAPGAPTPIP